MKKFNIKKSINKTSSSKKLVLSIILLSIFTVAIYSTYALYISTSKNKIVDAAKVGNFDVDLEILSIKVYNTTTKKYDESDNIPDKSSGKTFEKAECTKNGEKVSPKVQFDRTDWKLYIEVSERIKCNVYFTEYPIIVDITDNMIPVMYDGTKWVKADENNQDSTYKWYDYDTQKWANAVLVKGPDGINSRDYYKNNAPAGTPIVDADILAYYVYIPRYKYQLWNVNGDGSDGGTTGPVEIKIEFENNKVAPTINDKNGEWLTHPAFTFGGKELNGIWVGKFETTGTLTANGITIRPWTATAAATAITNQTVGPMFSTSRSIQTTTNNVYGFPDSTKADSHMMKNMEWGAVAYLSHSKYGKNEEVWINNSSSFYTGCAGTGVSATAATGCANAYTTTNGKNASTTGNITGIYDMSGGVHEYVMGNMVVSTSTSLGTLNVQLAGTFSPTPALKHYDSYTYDADETTHKRGQLGDATKETLITFGSNAGGWYSDSSSFLSSTYSWLRRGGNSSNGAPAGVFSHGRQTGEANPTYGFRLVFSVFSE